MLLGTFLKQPADRLDYDFDYSEWLTANDNLVSVVVDVFPNDSLEVNGLQVDQVTVIDPILKIWLYAGRNGIIYKLTITATTEDGRIKQDEFKIKVKDI